MSRSVLNGLVVAGRVGVGTNPTAGPELHVSKGATGISYTPYAGTVAVLERTSGDAFLTISSANASLAGIFFGRANAEGLVQVRTNGSTADLEVVSGGVVAYKSNADHRFSNGATGTVLMVLDAVSGQTADLQQWKVNASTRALVTAAGLGDFSTAGIRTKHESAATPTGATSGEVRVGTDKVWFQDAGTWKSIAVGGAAATSFATLAKFGTD